MRKVLVVAVASFATAAVVLASAAFASGSGDVEIRLNGCANMAFIGLPNTVEFWIKNDALLDSMKMGFEYTIGRNFIFNPAWGNYGNVNEEGDAVGAWSPLGLSLNANIDNVSPDQIHIVGRSIIGSGLPLHATHSLCYTMQVAIFAAQQPLVDGFCIDNVFISPDGLWEFTDFGAIYPPDFQGNPNSGTSNPDAPPVCFDIVDPCWANGDVDNDGVALTTNDYISLIKYVQYCSYLPPVLYQCDLYGDGVIDQLDVDMFAAYNQQGIGAFICGYPVPTRCDPCSYPYITGFSPGMNAVGVSKTASVTVVFDREFVQNTIGNTTVFEVVGQLSGKKTSGSFNFTGPPYQVTFDPATDFFGGEKVCVTIYPGVQSVCGAVRPCTFKWCFTTTAKKGNGSFAPGVLNYAGGNVSGTVAADFDRDGDLDLATIFDDSDDMSCMFNDGSGQLSLSRGVHPVGFNGAASGKPSSIVAGDYDNDDDIDVVVVRGGDDIDASSFVFMENDGFGGFTSTGYQLLGVDGLSHSTPSMITGDFNADGHPDLIMAIGDYAPDSAALMYFENNGEGVFNSTTRGVYPVGFQGGSSGKPAGIIADVDADNDMDLVSHFGTDSIWVFANDGAGQFEVKRGVYPVGYKGGAYGKPASLVAGDFDGNGSIDIGVAYADTDYVAMMFGEGDYTPGDADASGAVDIDDVVCLINYIFAGGPTPNPIESGDVNCAASVDIDDVVYLIQYIFAGGPEPCSTTDWMTTYGPPEEY